MSKKWFYTFKNFQNVYWHGKRHSAMVKECNGISEMKKNHITTQNDGTIKISVIKEQFINVTSIKRALSNEEWWINLINFPIESESGLNEINIVTLLSKIKVCAEHCYTIKRGPKTKNPKKGTQFWAKRGPKGDPNYVKGDPKGDPKFNFFRSVHKEQIC